MKTMIRFLNPHQIGGCVTLITYGDTTICIDYGQNLPGADNMRFESIDWKREKIDAVFFTHYHGDHIGRFMEIPENVPCYMGNVTRNIEINIHKHLSSFGEGAQTHAQMEWRLRSMNPKWELREKRLRR